MKKVVKIGINGFGRIGRLILRIASKRDDVEVVAINDPFLDVDYAKHMFEFDSVHGKFNGKVSVSGKNLIVNGKKIRFFSEMDPLNIKWKDCETDVVAEASGAFTSFEKAEAHIKAGAKKVVVTAPGKDMPTFIMGVNHKEYKPSMKIISNSSCTSNCLAPLVKIINDNFGIKEGLMTTVHSTTATQKTVDGPTKKDWRGGRASSVNIIPSSTGAAKSIGLVIPSLEGKLTGMAFRVPTVNVSVVDLTVKLNKKTTFEEIVSAMKKAEKTSMKGIVSVCEEPLVSQDFVGDEHTCIFDVKASIMLNDTFVKLVAWYDNEWAYSAKTIDLIKFIG